MISLFWQVMAANWSRKCAAKLLCQLFCCYLCKTRQSKKKRFILQLKLALANLLSWVFHLKNARLVFRYKIEILFNKYMRTEEAKLRTIRSKLLNRNFNPNFSELMIFFATMPLAGFLVPPHRQAGLPFCRLGTGKLHSRLVLTLLYVSHICLFPTSVCFPHLSVCCLFAFITCTKCFVNILLAGLCLEQARQQVGSCTGTRCVRNMKQAATL